MPDARDRRTRPRTRPSTGLPVLPRAEALVAAVVLALVAVHLVSPVSLLGDATYLAGVVLPAVLAWWAAARVPRERRLVARLVAAGVSASALGDLAWLVIYWRGGQPDASVADLGYLTSYLLLAAALVLVAVVRREPETRVDALVDALTIVTVSLLLLWTLTIEAIVGDDSAPAAVRAVWAAYPVADAVLLALVLRVLVSRRGRSHLGIAFAVGVGCWLFSDLGYLLFAPGDAVTALLDAGWMFGALFLALSIRWHRPRPARVRAHGGQRPHRPPRRGQAVGGRAAAAGPAARGHPGAPPRRRRQHGADLRGHGRAGRADLGPHGPPAAVREDRPGRGGGQRAALRHAERQQLRRGRGPRRRRAPGRRRPRPGQAAAAPRGGPRRPALARPGGRRGHHGPPRRVRRRRGGPGERGERGDGGRGGPGRPGREGPGTVAGHPRGRPAARRRRRRHGGGGLRHLRRQARRGRAGRRPRRRARGLARQVRVPGHHEPRDPHPHERGHRPDRPAARDRSGSPAAHVRRGRPRGRGGPAGDHRRHPRLLQGRGRPPGARADRLRPGAGPRGRRRSPLRQGERRRAGAARLLLAPVAAHLRGDPGRLRQVLLNLAANAIKFTPEGEVVLTAHLESRVEDRVTVRFEVTDTGIGIEDAALGRVFEPFSQADSTTTRRYGGTGLGLAIVDRLVGAMGGTVGVTSEAGTGSTFWFTVPLRLARAAVAPPPDLGLSGTSVLVVDDNATNRLVLCEQVEAWGMRSLAVTSGHEALAALRDARVRGRPYPLAILDLCMPGMNGLELADAISQDPEIAGVRTVLLTSGPDISAARALEAGIVARLTKPVRLHDLRVALSEALAGGADAARPRRSRPRPTHRGHLLVVEDDETNQLVATGISRSLGFTLDIACDGREALDALARRRYDAVLMDCQMPVLDGYDATRELRAREGGGPRTPVIAMTANAVMGDRERCLAAGMDDYLTKPFTPGSLDAVLRRWVPLIGSRPDDQAPARP